MGEITNKKPTLFEDIKHLDKDGGEYWLARELQPLLGYAKWQKFNNSIEKAKASCDKSGQKVEDNFVLTGGGKLGQIGLKSPKQRLDYKLSRYACYLNLYETSKNKRQNILEFCKKAKQQQTSL